MNEDIYKLWWANTPWWQVLIIALTLWSILCVGICLPLITWKLYARSIAKLFPKEPLYSRFHDHKKKHPFESTGKDECETNPSNEVSAKPKASAPYSTLPAADKYRSAGHAQDDVSKYQPHP